MVALPIALLFVTTDSVDMAVGGYAVLAAMAVLMLPGPAASAAAPMSPARVFAMPSRRSPTSTAPR
jgi:branched-chain amino acid transport system permease protein